MSPIGCVLIFQLGGGLLGSLMCTQSVSRFRLPEAWIDDPNAFFRYINRTMLFLMCNLLSWIATLGTLKSLPGQPLLRMLDAGTEWMDALLILALPLPLAAVFYLGFARMNRWWHGFTSGYRFTWRR